MEEDLWLYYYLHPNPNFPSQYTTILLPHPYNSLYIYFFNLQCGGRSSSFTLPIHPPLFNASHQRYQVPLIPDLPWDYFLQMSSEFSFSRFQLPKLLISFLYGSLLNCLFLLAYAFLSYPHQRMFIDLR